MLTLRRKINESIEVSIELYNLIEDLANVIRPVGGLQDLSVADVLEFIEKSPQSVPLEITSLIVSVEKLTNSNTFIGFEGSKRYFNVVRTEVPEETGASPH